MQPLYENRFSWPDKSEKKERRWRRMFNVEFLLNRNGWDPMNIPVFVIPRQHRDFLDPSVQNECDYYKENMMISYYAGPWPEGQLPKIKTEYFNHGRLYGRRKQQLKTNFFFILRSFGRIIKIHTIVNVLKLNLIENVTR